MQVYKALQNIQEFLFKNPIGKDMVNSFQKYKYRGIDQVIQTFSKPLYENKILTVVQPDLRVSTKIMEDGRTTLTRVVGTLRFICTEDGSHVDRSYVGHSKSQQGKDLESARSFAYRNALLETFCVPFEEIVEPELEGVDKEAPSEDGDTSESFLADFESELKKAKNIEQKTAILKRFDKAAELEGNKELRVQLNLRFQKASK